MKFKEKIKKTILTRLKRAERKSCQKKVEKKDLPDNQDKAQSQKLDTD